LMTNQDFSSFVKDNEPTRKQLRHGFHVLHGMK